MEGKLSLLYAASAEKTKRLVLAAGGHAAVAERIAVELPAYAHFLDNFAVPEDRQDTRHPYTAFIHPFLRDLLQEDRPELALLDLMQASLFDGPGTKDWVGSATDLHHLLSRSSASGGLAQDGVGKTFEKLAGRSPHQLGKMLMDLIESSEGAVASNKQRTGSGGTPRKVYVVRAPGAAQWEALRHLRPKGFEFSTGPEDFPPDLREDEVLHDRPLTASVPDDAA